jgi:peptidoglycan/xylan/chitin deacetylase (PgdA/CDA1 family)
VVIAIAAAVVLVGGIGWWIAAEQSGGPSTAPSVTQTVSPTPSASTVVPTTGSPTPSTTSPQSPSPTSTPTKTSESPPPQGIEHLLGVDWDYFETSRREIALTFDAGSSNAALERIVATLRDAHVPATFFVTGDFSRTYPSGVADIAASGFRLGNHSDHHLHYPELTDEEIRADLARAEEAIMRAGGVAAAPLFRFPFGDRTEADIRAVNRNGYACIRWTVDSLGWQGHEGGMTAELVTRRVLDASRPGAIVLMHVGANPDDGTTFDADALPSIISGLRERGYEFVDLSVLLAG